MDFESHLLNGIPQAEAAEYFLRIRGRDKVAVDAAAFNAALAELPESERTEVLKTASAATASMPLPGQLKKANMGGAMPGAATALPATGRGMNMSPAPPSPLPPTAMGQQNMKMGAADKDPEETGKERARASVAAEFEKEKHHKNETSGGILGRLAGAAVGGAAMHRAGHGNPLATLGGVALGHHMGGSFGREMGARADRAAHDKHASAFKLALDSMGLNADGKGQQMAQQPPAGEDLGTPQTAPAAPQLPAIEPRVPAAVQAWLEAQQAGDAAAEQSQAEFLRQKLEEARAETTAAQEQAASLQEQQAMHDEQQAQIQAQVQESIAAASAAQDQVLQEQQASAAMRMAYQQLRGQVLQIASSDPPALSSDAAALSAASTQAAPQSGPGAAGPPERGPAGQAPNPGTPNTPAPMGDETVTDKDGLKGNEPTFGNAEPTLSVSTKEPQGDAKTPGKEVLSHYRPLDLRSLLP